MDKMDILMTSVASIAAKLEIPVLISNSKKWMQRLKSYR